MIVLEFLTNIFGASMLLLFAVRLVRTGVERSFGLQLNRLLKRSGRGLGAAISGCLLAMMLQGATAVILMVSGLVSAGIAQLSTGLAIAIGADIGSAIVIRVLTFDITWLVPLLTAVGGWMYLKNSNAQWRNIGRAVLGIALILLSLQLISSAVAPIKDSAFLPNISYYLERDLVLAFLFGIIFTVLLHSSVASILVCLTLIDTQAITLIVAVTFVLGSNVGSALIPVWLTRASEITERHLPFLNLAVRGFAAALVFFLLEMFLREDGLDSYISGVNGVIAFHLAFNVMLLGFLPFADFFASKMKGTFSAEPNPEGAAEGARFVAARDAEKLGLEDPVSVLRRDVLSMLDTVSSMLSECEHLIDNHSEVADQNVLKLAETVGNSLDQLRTYYSRILTKELASDEKRQMVQLLEYSIRLKHSADIVVRRILPIAQEMRDSDLSFSENGRTELEELRCLSLANTFLAFEVVSTWQAKSARNLVVRKEEVTRTEQKSRKRHFKRISSSGNRVSLETSDLHLELSAALKEINSKIATIAYVVLSNDGHLAESRLLGGLTPQARS